jgi:hypothetical protein
VNEEALAHWGLSRQKQTNKLQQSEVFKHSKTKDQKK